MQVLDYTLSIILHFESLHSNSPSDSPLPNLDTHTYVTIMSVYPEFLREGEEHVVDPIRSDFIRNKDAMPIFQVVTRIGQTSTVIGYDVFKYCIHLLLPFSIFISNTMTVPTNEKDLSGRPGHLNEAQQQALDEFKARVEGEHDQSQRKWFNDTTLL